MPRHRQTRTRLDPRTRRAQILDAAESVLRATSPSELTFEQVAEAAGVSRALVYNYFGDRSGLLAAVELRTLEDLNSSLHASMDATLDPAAQLRPLALAYLAFAEAHGPTWTLLAHSGGVHHPSVEAARRIRVERLATLWGGTEQAAVAARTVTTVLESATITTLGADGEATADALARVETVCRILTSGLDAGLGHPAPLHH